MTPQKKKLLVFGYGFSVIFSVIALRWGWKHGWGAAPGILILLGGTFLLLTLFRQDWLLKVYNRWMRVARFIGGVVTAIILTLMYYGVFSFVGILRRVLKKDWLETKIDPKATSYWIKRELKPFNKTDYTKQF
ncbi:MAG TPA: hypothetical protein DD723_09360 [Candidatus Omnitrophica bacterium]|nr:hypothetical protein [Candidatus Omnitrophota bacterium]